MNEEFTDLLAAWRAGDRSSEERLFAAVYDQLKELARDAMSLERSGHTLQPTALVNEAYMRMARASVDLRDRVHFLAVASRIMRRLLVDHARARRRQKRGGDHDRVTLDEGLTPGDSGEVDLLVLDRALGALERVDARKAHFVQLRYLAGLDNGEIAAVAGVSVRTVKRELQLGRAFLKKELAG